MNTIKIGINKLNKDGIDYLLSIKKDKEDNFKSKIVVQNGWLIRTDSLSTHALQGYDVPDGVYDFERTSKSLFLTQDEACFAPNIISLFKFDKSEVIANDHYKFMFCDICRIESYDYDQFDKAVNKNNKVIAYIKEGNIGDRLLKLMGDFNGDKYMSVLMAIRQV